MINHPLVGSLADKSVDELADTIASLTKKLAFASSTGRYAMANQIQMVLQSYRTELGKKQEEMFRSSSDMIQGKIDIS
jgi:hypothetical protein